MATETEKQNELLGQLLQRMMAAPPAAAVAGHQVMPAGIMPAGQMQGFGGMNGFGPAPQIALQPTGVSVTLSIPLPDGSTVPVQLQFGPEYAQNIQGLLQAVMAAYGQVLKVYPPRQQYGGGYGQGGYGQQGGGYGGNGYRGRSWGRRY